MAQILAFPHRPPARPSVLLVDDEYLVRGVLGEILQENGFAVVAVASAPEAMAVLGKPQRIDLVFDVKVKPTDSVELARWIGDHRPGLPVILASGHCTKICEAADLRGVEFFRKLFDFDAVIEKVRETIALTQARSA